MTPSAMFDRVTTVALLIAVAYLLVVRGQTTTSLPSDGEAIGKAAPAIPNIAYASAKRTLVLSLRSTCPFCSESMPFYSRLMTQRAAKASSIRVVAVSNQSTETMSEYLESHNLVVDSIAQVDVVAWKDYLRTPTILIVGADGNILGRWTGQLESPREAEVERVLGVNSSVRARRLSWQ